MNCRLVYLHIQVYNYNSYTCIICNCIFIQSPSRLSRIYGCTHLFAGLNITLLIGLLCTVLGAGMRCLPFYLLQEGTTRIVLISVYAIYCFYTLLGLGQSQFLGSLSFSKPRERERERKKERNRSLQAVHRRSDRKLVRLAAAARGADCSVDAVVPVDAALAGHLSANVRAIHGDRHCLLPRCAHVETSETGDFER